MSELSDKIKSHLMQRIQAGELTNSEIMDIGETILMYLNPQTVADYARNQKIEYRGAMWRINNGKVNMRNMFGVNFVIDND